MFEFGETYDLKRKKTKTPQSIDTAAIKKKKPPTRPDRAQLRRCAVPLR